MLRWRVFHGVRQRMSPGETKVAYDGNTDPCKMQDKLCGAAVSCVVNDCSSTDTVSPIFYDSGGNVICERPEAVPYGVMSNGDASSSSAALSSSRVATASVAASMMMVVLMAVVRA